MDNEITTDDMARMRQEGSHLAYIRMAITPPTGPTAPPGTTLSTRTHTDHIPGAWPAGTGTGQGTRCSCPTCAAYAA